MPLKIFQRKPKTVGYEEPKRLNVSLGRKYNVGNFESVDLHVYLSRDVEPAETVESAFDAIFTSVRAELNREAEKLRLTAKV